MSAGLYRKQYEALAEYASPLSLDTSEVQGSFNERFCILCRLIVTGLGAEFVPTREGSFLTRKALYLQQVAKAIGATITNPRAGYQEIFLKAAKSIWLLDNDGTAPDFGSSLDWRVYQYLHHSTNIPEIPINALRDSTGDPIRDSNGEYILALD